MSASFIASASDFFTQSVRPILEQNCFECHAHNGEPARGGLILDSRKGMMIGGDYGPAIVPGDADSSLLIQAVRHTHDEIRMPKDRDPLDPSDIETLKRWIDDGAVWPGSAETKVLTDAELAATHWAYQPISDPTLPSLSSEKWKQWVRNPIDQFIARELESRALEPGPEAKPNVLQRRLAYALTGLPPVSGNETVEELLLSPEYGRKWGRHWLDVARYADTAGDNADYPIPEMALYRDYIVDAFNKDLPFNELIKEQIAGDLMDSSGDSALRRRRVIATSFVANSMRYCDDLKKDLPLVIDDTVDAIGTAFMGMTLSCAKCHDHKYDPIPTADYYALYGFFSSTRFPYAGREGRQVPINLVPTTSDLVVRKRVREINDHVRHELLTGGRLKIGTERGQAIVMLLEEQRAASELAFGVIDSAKTEDAHIHRKGNPKKKGPKVPRGFFSAITPDAKADIPEGQSGRLQLAEWIASPDHPLTARVIVNRVWAWHFGKGLVPTVDNFGISGEKPTHPELLDYLAQRFIASGWSIKALHRLILNSATYRQAWRPEIEGLSTDSANSLYWRFDRRRLTAEELRDSALAASGELDLANPGKHPFPKFVEHHFTQHKPYEAEFQHNHRSIYLVTSRIRRQEFSSLFDAADPTSSTGLRRASTVPLQALYLLNSKRFNDIVDSFARRLEESPNPIPDAYRLAYSRKPSFREIQRFSDVISQNESPWRVIAHALLLSNEFSYLD